MAFPAVLLSSWFLSSSPLSGSMMMAAVKCPSTLTIRFASPFAAVSSAAAASSLPLLGRASAAASAEPAAQGSASAAAAAVASLAAYCSSSWRASMMSCHFGPTLW